MVNLCQWLLDNDEPCGERTEGSTPFCGSHNRQLRKESENTRKAKEKREAILARPKKVYKATNKVSEKRKEINVEYFKLVEQFKKDNPHCKANVNHLCTKQTDDPHHRKGRGVYLLDVSTWLPTCRSCHSYIEAHPKEAKEKGWSESRLSLKEPTV